MSRYGYGLMHKNNKYVPMYRCIYVRIQGYKSIKIQTFQFANMIHLHVR